MRHQAPTVLTAAKNPNINVAVKLPLKKEKIAAPMSIMQRKAISSAGATAFRMISYPVLKIEM
jgi:hypothetical protein